MSHARISRRQALRLGTAATLALSPAARLLAQDKNRTFKIGACDWSLGRAHRTSALDLAKEIGLDGVQVSFGPTDVESDLRKPEVRREYLVKCEKLNVEIASLALGVLNSKPYASDSDAERWVVDCVRVLPEIKQRIGMLAFFSKGDIKGKPEARNNVIRRLKKVAPQAEKAGVILAIESWLSADEHIRILDAVGSPAVKVYYDVANMEKQGYDIYQEIRQLGRDRICQFHAKENGHLLGKGRGKIDFTRVRAALDDIGWSGWLIIEGATVSGKSLEDCYRWNQQYLRSVFPTEA